MKSKVLISVVSCLITAFIMFVIMSGTNSGRKTVDDTYAVMKTDKMEEIDKYIEKYSIYEVDDDAAAEGIYYGYMLGLEDDGYKAYYSEEDYKTVTDSVKGNFGGFGIQLYNIDSNSVLTKGLLVYRVLGNSPAEAVGIHNADYIRSVDGTELIGLSYSDAYDLLVSKTEVDESCTLTIDRDGKELSLDIKAEQFTQRYVDYKVLDGNIGYVAVYQFGSETSSEFRQALTALEEENVKGYIFDLRNNPGGELDTVTSMVDMLVPVGDVIVTTERKTGTETIKSTEEPLVNDKPLTVLLNSSSASASELFASALRDLKDAQLIGEQSYGKGVGQTTYPLSDGSYIKITTFKYFTASHTDYDGVGLEPDISVGLDSEKAPFLYSLTLKEDTQLYTAWKTVSEAE